MVVAGKIEVAPDDVPGAVLRSPGIDGKEAVTFLVRVKESLEDWRGWCWISEDDSASPAPQRLNACGRQPRIDARLICGG